MPTVTLSASAATLVEPANLSLTATAAPTGTTFSKLRIYLGTTVVGESTSSPYTLSLSALPAGIYQFSARLAGETSDLATSSPLSIVVNAEPLKALMPSLGEGRWIYKVTAQRTTRSSYGLDSATQTGLLRLRWTGTETDTSASLFGLDGLRSILLVKTLPSTMALRPTAEGVEARMGTESVWNSVLRPPGAAPWKGVSLLIPDVHDYGSGGNTAKTCTSGSSSAYGPSLLAYSVTSSYDNSRNQYTYRKYQVSATEIFVPGIGLGGGSWDFTFDDSSDPMYFVFQTQSVDVSLRGFRLVSTDGAIQSWGDWDTSDEAPSASPSGLSAETRTRASVLLSWTDECLNENGFRIERKGGTDAVFSQLAVCPEDATTYEDTQVKANAYAYTYRIRATNPAGDSGWSSEVTSSIIDDPDRYLLTLESDGHGTVRPGSPTTVIAGAPTTIETTGAAGYSFVGWTVASGSGATMQNPTSPSTTVTLFSGDASLRANYLYWTTFGSGSLFDRYLSGPTSIVLDQGGAMLVTDAGGHRVVQVSATSAVNPLASFGSIGTGAGQFQNMRGIAFDPSGRILIADSGANRIVRIDGMNGAGWVTLGVFGGGTGQFSGPCGVVSDSAGRIYIADTGNNRIVRVDDMTGSGWTSLSASPLGEKFASPRALAFDQAGRLYAACGKNLLLAPPMTANIVRIDDMSGAGWTSYGSYGSGPGQFNWPSGLAIDSAGRIFVADSYNNRIVRFDDLYGAGWVSLGQAGSGAGQFATPTGLCVDASGRVFVADSGNGRVVRTAF